MTPYELMDLRSMLGERLMTVGKFWLTATFAVYSAAFYAHDQLDTFTILALTAFYLACNFTAAATFRTIQRQMNAVSLDGERWAAGHDDVPAILGPEALSSNKSSFTIFYGLNAASFVGFLAYLAINVI